jgi:hypothetical protein
MKRNWFTGLVMAAVGLVLVFTVVGCETSTNDTTSTNVPKTLIINEIPNEYENRTLIVFLDFGVGGSGVSDYTVKSGIVKLNFMETTPDGKNVKQPNVRWNGSGEFTMSIFWDNTQGQGQGIKSKAKVTIIEKETTIKYSDYF